MAQAGSRAGLRRFFYPFDQLADFTEANSMNRSLYVLPALLLTCFVLATPAPDPFVSGWDRPIDPDRDCKIKRYNRVLTIEIPGGDHDYDPLRNRVNAPRLSRDLEGDFEMQVRVRIDCLPSVQSTVKGQPSCVSVGFLIIPADNIPTNCIRLEYRVTRKGDGVDDCALELRRDELGGQVNFIWNERWKNWPFKAIPEHVYLRLERWGDILYHSISPDGKLWVRVGGGWIVGLPYKLEVGLAAYSTSADPSKVHFDQLMLVRGKRRERWDFVSGWNDPVNPDKDCKIRRDKNVLSIEMPGSNHDYDPVRKRFNAPRLLCDLEGDFDLVVRVRIDYRFSAPSTVQGQPSFVSAGFLLIHPEANESICDRMEYAVSQSGIRPDAYAVKPLLDRPRRDAPVPKGTEADSYAVMKTWLDKGGTPEMHVNSIWERGWQNWPLSQKSESAYLRLEQRGEWICFFISPDGKKWTSLNYRGRRPAKRKVGLAAYTTSPHPSKVSFDQLKLWRPKKKE